MDYKSSLDMIQQQMRELRDYNSEDFFVDERKDTEDLLNEIGLEIQRQGGI